MPTGVVSPKRGVGVNGEAGGKNLGEEKEEDGDI